MRTDGMSAKHECPRDICLIYIDVYMSFFSECNGFCLKAVTFAIYNEDGMV